MIGYAQSENDTKEEQVEFLACVDVKNVAKGSEATNYKKEFDIKIGATLTVCSSAWKIGLFYENFHVIGFYKVSAGVGYQFEPIKNLRITPFMERSLIIRQGNVEPFYETNSKFHGADFRVNVKYRIVENLYGGFNGGFELRGDKKEAGYTDWIVINFNAEISYVIYY